MYSWKQFIRQSLVTVSIYQTISQPGKAKLPLWACKITGSRGTALNHVNGRCFEWPLQLGLPQSLLHFKRIKENAKGPTSRSL